MGLTVKEVEAAGPGLTLDGDGLYLQVGQNGNRSWIYRYALNGRTRDMGLGSTKAITLKRARELAAEARTLRAQGIDPIEDRKARRIQLAIEATKFVSFAEAAERFIASHEAGWRNPKHRQQWRNTLSTYVYPTLDKLPVQAIDTAIIMRIIEPLWRTKPETASRVRGRIEQIIDWSKTMGLRSGENPARWKGHLDNLLPAKTKVRTVTHHASVPYRELPVLMAELRARESASARALEFLILAAARTTEVIEARWSEFNPKDALWTIPKERMKAGRPHIVPLSKRALEIITGLPAGQPDAHVWGLSGAALSKMLALLGRSETVHGFRSTFKTWSSERTTFRDAVSEACLAHIEGDKVKAAYDRATFEQHRRELMELWSQYCASTPIDDSNKVVPLRASA
jgi:integrase